MEKWVAAASLALTVVFGWVVWDAFHPEWIRYEKAYYRFVLRNARNEAQKEWVRSQGLKINQIETRELGTVERCLTCHLGVDNPMFRDAPEPFRQHNSLLQSHPPARLGCVVCHGGEDRAVTTLQAHGEGDVLATPLLRGDYLQAACYHCHGSNTLPPETTAAVLRGRQLMNRYLCLGCHQINGEGGEEGPDLSRVGSHRNWLWLYAHLARPQAITVGSTMPVFPLPREQIKDITIYLMTLLDSRDPRRNTSLHASRVAAAYRPERPVHEQPSVVSAGLSTQFQYDGSALFRGAGCILCHAIGNTGGDVGPALTYIGRARSAEVLERLLRNPDDVLPGGKMPQLYLNEPQIKALTGYLSSLQ
jgi:mono/diheme cytochrome c family protein